MGGAGMFSKPAALAASWALVDRVVVLHRLGEVRHRTPFHADLGTAGGGADEALVDGHGPSCGLLKWLGRRHSTPATVNVTTASGFWRDFFDGSVGRQGRDRHRGGARCRPGRGARAGPGGRKVVVNDLGGSVSGEGADKRPAEEVAELIRSRGGEAVANYDDVADWNGAKSLIQQAVETFGTLDILVNNAGILRDGMIFKMTEEDFDAVIRVHLKGTFATTHHAANYWRDRSKGGNQPRAAIVNTVSSAPACRATSARPTTARPRPPSPPSRSSPAWSWRTTACGPTPSPPAA